MPTWNVSFNRLAIKDFRQARAYYANRSTAAPGRFVDEVDAAVQRICQDPEAWPADFGRYRRISLNRFPHSLIYYVRMEGDIRIVAVAHPRRRVGYWRRRT